MNKYYFIFITFMLGFIIALLQFQPILPVFEGNQPFYHGIRGKNQVSLTFNVDWGQEYIPGILKVLENNDIKATFFVTGKWARQYPGILKTIADKGHEIGNHGYEHKHPSSLNKDQLIDLIKKNEELIYEITGEKTDLFAPPYGEVDKRIVSIVEEINYKTILWSADTIDWQRPSPEIIVQRAVNKIEDGGIILMHPTEPSLQALDDIINRIERRGFNFVTVSQLIKY